MLKKETPAQLAERILSQVDAALCVKLRELKDDLLKLRAHFRNPNVKKPISGCKTWADFCDKKLHRSKRAVNMLLADKPRREETSQPDDEEKDTFSASTATGTKTSDAPADEECASEEEEVAGAEEDKRQDETGAWEEAKSSAKKKVRHFFTPLDSVQAIEGKMNDLLDGLIPCRKFVVTVKEVTEEAL